jgi:magnesium transporter
MIRSYYLTETGEVRTDLTREEIVQALASSGVLWVDFFRATREESALLSEVFHFHPLAVDDCLRPVFRPKVDAFEDHLFVITHGADPAAQRSRGLRTLEMDAFLGRNYLVTLHQTTLRSTQQLIEECDRATKLTLSRGPDFLLYMILDRMAENYAPILSRLEAQVAQLEDHVLKGDVSGDILSELMRLRREMLHLRRVLFAQRDAIGLLSHQGGPMVSERARVYFRDVVDVYQRAIEVIEIERDALSSARDTHLTMISNRTNEIMKVATIVATILFPMSIITGIYGMNFKHTPEFDWKYGYPFALGIMVVVALSMAYYFRRKRWL